VASRSAGRLRRPRGQGHLHVARGSGVIPFGGIDAAIGEPGAGGRGPPEAVQNTSEEVDIHRQEASE